MNLDVAGKSLAGRCHLFFDLDGTLVDSRAAIVNAYHHVFASVLRVPFAMTGHADLQKLLAMRPIEVFSQATKKSVDDCLAAYSDFYVTNCARDVQSYEGARAMLAQLRALGRSVGIVTNKGHQRAALDLSSTRLIDISDLTVLIGAEHTIERKPHPAPLIAALELSGAAASQSIYVGDGPHDMEAAVQAGMACVGASYGYYPADTLSAAGADALIACPLDLLTLIKEAD